MTIWKKSSAQVSAQPQHAQISKQLARQINSGAILQSSSAGLNWATLNPSNTISLTSATGNIGMGGGLGIFQEDYQPHVKKYEVFEIEEDILLLSVVWERMRKQRNEGVVMDMPSSIIDNILFKNITHNDRIRTEELRDYYHKKLMMWTLNEIRLTNFRTDLKELLVSNGKIFQEKMKPLAYRMPEFYDYDIKFDEMMIEHNTLVNPSASGKTEKRLKLVDIFSKKRRHAIVKEYWFSDNNDNLNLLVVNKDNSLNSLLELHSKNPFNLQGIFSTKTRDNRQYCVVEKYSFL